MTEHDHELIRDYLDGRLSPADLESLNQRLENNAHARARFRALATLEEGLRDLAELPALSPSAAVASAGQASLIDDLSLSAGKPSPIISGLFHRPLISAAAGLVLGIFCTSAIWAASQSGRQKILTLIHESFEFAPSPSVTGIPTELETWSGDFTEVVEMTDGLLPLHGERMLQFLRADHDAKESAVGYICDLYRVVDLRPYGLAAMKDDTLVSVEAGFRSVPFQDPNRFQCGISIYAMAGVPANREGWNALFETSEKTTENSLATAQRWIFLDGEATQWQKGRAELRIPGDAKFLVIGIRVSDRSAIQPDGEEPPAVEFSGQFVDDIRVTLRRSPSHP